MLDNKNHQWPLIVSAERSRVTSFLSKGPKMKWPCAKTAQADLTRGPGRLTCEKNFMRFGTPVGFTGCMRTKFFVFAKRQAAFEKRVCGLLQRTPCPKAHVYRPRRVFSHAHVAGKNRSNFILSSAEAKTLRGFWCAWWAHCFCIHALGKRKGRSNDRRINIAYQMPPCLVNPFSWIRTTSPGCPSCGQSFYTTSQLAKLPNPCYYIVRKGRQVINLKAQ